MVEPATKADVVDLRDKMDSLKRELTETARMAHERTSAWVKENPVSSASILAGVAAGIGFAVGFMIGRRPGRE